LPEPAKIFDNPLDYLPPHAADSDHHLTPGNVDVILIEFFFNTATQLWLWEDYFPLTLALSPIGGEGKKRDRLEALPS
jgi:hypothetical protein